MTPRTPRERNPGGSLSVHAQRWAKPGRTGFARSLRRSPHRRPVGRSEPADALNPAVVALLIERGLDPGREFPKPLTDEAGRSADVIVTMGCGDTCPVFPGKRYLDWDLADPAGKSIEEVRPIINDIDQRVKVLMGEVLGLPAP